MSLSVTGTVAPMKPGEEDASFAGTVWFGDDGNVAAVTKRGQRPPAGVTADRAVDVDDAFVYPGLVDLHSHLGYNTLPLWTEPSQETPFRHHDSWPDAPTYREAIGWPSWTLLDRAPECVLAYVQVRALAGGTTSIQGWPNVSRSPTNALVRCVDDDQVGPTPDPVMVSALTEDVSKLADRAPKLGAGRVFVYHCAEGQRGTVVASEFDDVDTAQCLQRGLALVHCSAVEPEAFARWKRAVGRGSAATGAVVWSPFSNLWLYGMTTDVPSARAKGLTVCLGTDWGPSGTKNLLGELKVARLWSDHEGWGLSDQALAEMVTAGPGDVLARAWRQPAGRLVAGGVGDAVVVARGSSNPWTNLVRARESDVLLVLVGGRARFGRFAFMTTAGEAQTTSVPVGGVVRRVPLARPDDPTRPWTWTDVVGRLNAVRADAARNPPSGPAGARGPRPPASARAGDPPGTPRLVARPDMPGGPAQAAGPPPKGRTVAIPPLDPVSQTLTWLATVRGRGFHDGVLDPLGDFYR